MKLYNTTANSCATIAQAVWTAHPIIELKPIHRASCYYIFIKHHSNCLSNKRIQRHEREVSLLLKRFNQSTK